MHCSTCCNEFCISNIFMYANQFRFQYCVIKIINKYSSFVYEFKWYLCMFMFTWFKNEASEPKRARGIPRFKYVVKKKALRKGFDLDCSKTTAGFL